MAMGLRTRVVHDVAECWSVRLRLAKWISYQPCSAPWLRRNVTKSHWRVAALLRLSGKGPRSSSTVMYGAAPPIAGCQRTPVDKL